MKATMAAINRKNSLEKKLNKFVEFWLLKRRVIPPFLYLRYFQVYFYMKFVYRLLPQLLQGVAHKNISD